MAEAEEVRAALAGYRGTAQMTFQNRFFPATMRAKQLIDEGALGEVLEFPRLLPARRQRRPGGAAEVEAHGRGRRRGDRRPGLARAGPGRLAHRPVPVGHGRHADRLSRAALARRSGRRSCRSTPRTA